MLFRTPGLWVLDASQENVGLGSILCFLYQSLHNKTHAEVPLTAPRNLPAPEQSCRQCSISLRAFACRAASRGALSWRTKLCHCRGCERAADYRAQFRDIAWVSAGWCITTSRAPKGRQSVHSGKLDPCHREARRKQLLVFWGRHVDTFRFNWKRQTRMPAR